MQHCRQYASAAQHAIKQVTTITTRPTVLFWRQASAATAQCDMLWHPSLSRREAQDCTFVTPR